MTTGCTRRRSSALGAGCALVALAVVRVALGTPEAARAACDPVPRRTGCKQATDSLDLIDIQGPFPPGDFGPRDRVTWKIPKLEATSAADLPDPQTTDYAVCFYVLNDFEDFVLGHEAIARAGLSCGRQRCWTRNANGGVGYNGGSLRPDGIVALRVRPGADGRAQLGFIGRGLNLGSMSPARIFGGEPIMQLQAGASCWSAMYLNGGDPPAIRTNTRYRKKGSTEF